MSQLYSLHPEWRNSLASEVPMAALLIALKAELDICTEKGETPLFVAAREGHVQVSSSRLFNYRFL